MPSANTVIRLRGLHRCAGLSESSLVAKSCCRLCRALAYFYFVKGIYMSSKENNIG